MKEQISVQNFVEEFLNKKIANSKIAPNAVEEFIRQRLEIIDYIPFQTKRDIVEIIIAQNIREENGIKKIDDISQYLSFIVAMLCSHTNLQFGDNPAEDYDALNKLGLIEQIVALFQKDFTECETLLKMGVANELADNNVNVIVSKFLNGVLAKIDQLSTKLEGVTENLDMSNLLGESISEEEVAKILGFVNKSKK